MFKKLIAASLLVAGFTTSASATSVQSITITTYTTAQEGQFRTDFGNATTGLLIEDFEDASRLSGVLAFDGSTNINNGTSWGVIQDGQSITSNRVGSFTTLGTSTGVGTGSTCDYLTDPVGTPASTNQETCTNIGYMVGSINGQGNIFPDGNGDRSVNSADTDGILWTVNNGSRFTELVFALRDPADQAAKSLTVTVEGSSQSETHMGNGEFALVRVVFNKQMPTALIEIATSSNDAFTIDGVSTNVVPLPAAGWMLIAGLGGLAALRRRKQLA